MNGLIHSQASGRVMEQGDRDSLNRAEEVPFEFRLLHVLCFLVAMPFVVATRALGSSRGSNGESVLAETNRIVLTALGTAFMA